MADGRLLVVGGNNSDNYGIKDVNIFDPVSKTWTRVADMKMARWYPSVVPLPDGRVVVVGGLVSPRVFPGLVLMGNNRLTGLKIASFNGPQIRANGGGNDLTCVVTKG